MRQIRRYYSGRKKHGIPHRYNGGGDKTGHRGLETVEAAGDRKAVPEASDKAGYHKYYYKRRKDDAQSCAQGAGDSAELRSDICRYIHGKRPRRAFAYRYKIDKIRPGDPAAAFYLGLNEREHGITAAEGEKTYFEKYIKKFEINHRPSLLVSTKV